MRSIEDNLPVFAVSVGRSGSTMLAKAMAQHDRILAIHETQPHLLVENAMYRQGRITREQVEKRLNHKRANIIEYAKINNLVYFESSHFLSELITPISDMYSAKFIQLVRNGRDFVQSAIAKGWCGEVTFRDAVFHRIRKYTGLALGNSWQEHWIFVVDRKRSQVENLARLWVLINDTIARDISTLDESRKRTVRVEDIGPELIAQLYGFVGVDANIESLNRSVRVASARPNSSSSLKVEKPPWDYRKEIEFMSVAGETMVRYGYV